MTEDVEIKLHNKLSDLASVNQALTEFAWQHGLSDNVLHDLSLALGEILTNVISYGYTDGGEHEITVRLSIESGEIESTSRMTASRSIHWKFPRPTRQSPWRNGP